MRPLSLPLLIFLSYESFAQSVPHFEVASVKVNPAVGGRTTRLIEPGKITYLNLSLGEFIALAYNVKHYQISGPEWILNYRSDNRYDVIAKADNLVSAEQLKRMLEPLLAERFHLVVHRENRELPVYALVVDKGGPKFKRGDGGAPQSYPDGSGGLIYQNISMEALADGLSNFMGAVDGRPVLNRTGLPDAYTFKANLYGLPAGLGPGEQKQMAQQKMDTTSREDNPVFTALQDQLGLKLESQKAPLEILVIDHADKIPTAN